MRMPIVAVATQPARDEAPRGMFPDVRGGENLRSDLAGAHKHDRSEQRQHDVDPRNAARKHLHLPAVRLRLI
jgi:hypothetical protein